MRKFMKSAISAVMALLMLISGNMFFTSATESTPVYYCDENYIYEILPNETISIHCYIGTETHVNIPSYIGNYPISTIESLAFTGTDVLYVYMPDTLRTVKTEAFAGCQSLQIVRFPSKVKNLGDGIFRNCRNLHTVMMNSSTQALGKYMFYACENLESITIPYVREIPKGAFAHCSSLKSVSLPEGVKTIDDYAFFGSGVKTLSLPSTLQAIKSYAFADTLSLTTIHLIGGDMAYMDIAVTAFKNSAFEVPTPEIPPTEDNTTPDEPYPPSTGNPDPTEPKPPTDDSTTPGEVQPTEPKPTTPAETLPTEPVETQPTEPMGPPPTDATDTDTAPTDPVRTEPTSPPPADYIPGRDYNFSSYSDTEEMNLYYAALNTAENNRSYLASLAWNVRTMGDVNMDGGVNIKDATMVQKHSASLIPKEHPDFNFKNADVNTDGKVNVRDATVIQKVVAGILGGFV